MRSDLTVDRSLLGAVEAMVRRRVPASDVDDVVQAALADAVASADAPREPEAFRRWLAGVVRHKVADFHRRNRRELALDDAPEPGHVPSHEERDLLRWARRQLPPSGDAEQTLEWMMHEADGEKLEAIAERERMPAARVRQRVHRLRAFFRERWHRELVLAALVTILVVLGWMIVRARLAPPPIAKDPAPSLQPQPTITPNVPAPVDSAVPEPLLPAVEPSETVAPPLPSVAPPKSSAPNWAAKSAPTAKPEGKVAPPTKKKPTKTTKPMGDPGSSDGF